MSKTKINKSLTIDPVVAAKIENEAKQQKRNFSNMVELVLSEYLKNRKKQQKNSENVEP